MSAAAAMPQGSSLLQTNDLEGRRHHVIAARTGADDGARDWDDLRTTGKRPGRRRRKRTCVQLANEVSEVGGRISVVDRWHEAGRSIAMEAPGARNMTLSTLVRSRALEHGA